MSNFSSYIGYKTKNWPQKWFLTVLNHLPVNKLPLSIAPAQDTLQKLLDEGHAGTFDFAFVDADKTGYDQYYELCLKLLRTGGIVAFDNTLWSARVLAPAEECDESTLALKKLNAKLASDQDRAYVVQINVGDGYSIVLKR